MATYNIEHSDLTYYSEINKIQFYVLSSEENYVDSNVSITNKELFKGDLPVAEGPYDAHMGTTDHNWQCLTCQNPKNICPGHSGSIDLRYPVKNPLFRDNLLKWLKIICFKCGRLLYTKTVNAGKTKLLQEYVKLSKDIIMCPYPDCKEPHPSVYEEKYEKSSLYAEYYGDAGGARVYMYNHIIQQILNRISDEDVEKVGKPLESHPRNFILDIIRVPPNTIRPDIRRVGGAHSKNNDITALTKNIVEINDLLPLDIPESTGEMPKDIHEMCFNLCMTYSEMVKGSSATGNQVRLMTNTNKTPSSIASRMPKKEGRFRRNLMGKRTRYMLRSVITGDNSLRVDEIGVPVSMARALQIPEVVRPYNRDRLQIYYMNKDVYYPGCSGVKRASTGNFHRIQYMDPNYELQNGDVVYRNIIDGDYIGFNRQPSLLFGNISCMRVVVMEKGLTLRMNVSAVPPFNADFDGDAMNCLISQNIQARVELANLSWIGNWMISYQNHSPYFGCYQDSLVGSSELTRSDIKINKQHAMDLFAFISPHIEAGGLNFADMTTLGRALIGKFMPKFNYPRRSASIYKRQYANLIKYDPDEIWIQFNRGELITGSLDKSTIGHKIMGSIFQVINNEYGAHVALEAIYNFHQIVARFFLYRGYTLGIKDINISDTAVAEVKDKMRAMMEDSKSITEKLFNRELTPPVGTTLEDFYEMEQQNALEPGDDFVEPILNDIDFRNNKMARLVFTGSKGKETNVININGAYGQTSINGRRPVRNFGFGRTSPYFTRYDETPEANGYINSSYREGIKPKSFQFGASEARAGLISNALSTSVSGAQNRLSIKNLESIICDNMRKSVKSESLIQPLYAETGIDPRKTEKVKFLTVLISDADMEKRFKAKVDMFDKVFRNKQVEQALGDEFEQLLEDRREYRRIQLQVEHFNPGKFIMSEEMQMPINPFRIIEDVIYNYSDVINDIEDPALKMLDPILCIERVRELCHNLPYAYYNNMYESQALEIPEYIDSAVALLRILIRTYLSTANLASRGVLNFHLNIIIDKIRATFKRSLIEYGSTIGIIAAQCISEPMTQYVLDSKHRSGGGGGTKTNTIDRIKEIMGAKDTDKMKNTTMTIMVLPELEDDKAKVQEIANNIEMMDFERFIKSEYIFYEEYANPIHPEFKHEEKLIKDFQDEMLGIPVPSTLSKWCVRYELDKEELIINNMQVITIIAKLRENYPNMYLVYTTLYAPKVIIRCYLDQSMIRIPTAGFNESIIFDLVKKINQTIIRGINKIKYAEVIKVAKSKINNDGAVEMYAMYAISTVGTNLEEILYHPQVDKYRTQTDSIKEFEDMYGIEASRNKIINEIRKTMSSEDVIRHHCTVFADEMTYSGRMSNIQKAGMQIREMNNVSLRLSFQSPIQVIEHAAINALTDKISGISGPLIAGQTPNIGTTYNNVCINEDFVRQQSVAESSDNIEDAL